ncbi:MAG: BMC domain-containing protein [Brevinemataceae bacterium]
MSDNSPKQRIIQEYVPGKQVTLSHIIVRPEQSMLKKIGLSDYSGISVGIMTITPSEAVIIASDIVLKMANTEIGFLDRFNGSLIIVGSVSDVEESLKEANKFLSDVMGFATSLITKS